MEGYASLSRRTSVISSILASLNLRCLMTSHIQGVLVLHSCPTLCNPMDCSPPGSSVLGILQASIFEWVAISFSRKSSQPGHEPESPALQADSLPLESPGSVFERLCN